MHHPRLAYQSFAQQQAWQNEAMERLLRYLQKQSPFYKKLFQQQGIVPENIRSVRDLSKLPTTTKSQIQQHNWDFLCVDKTAIREYTATSGTLGRPVTIALTASDLKRLAYNEEQSFRCAGAQQDDTFQLMLTLDRQFMAGMAYYSGINNIGAAVVRTGPGLPAMQWETIERLQVNSLVAVPSFILKLIEYAQANGIDLHNSPVKKAICIGDNLREQHFELNALAQRIKQDWDIQLYGTYASTEMQTAFTECEHGKGGHEQPDLIITEIVDDEGNALPPGEYGEVTITTLGVEAMPLLRYRTGDIACLFDEPCACGRYSRRISPLKGRKQQMIKYKGTTLYPPAIFEVLNKISMVKEYVVEVNTDELGSDTITLYIYSEIPDENLLKRELQSKLRVTPLFSFLTAEAMQRLQFPAVSRKPVKFVDKRSS
ncbi:MAG TPA: AMP-binding protein [Flavipsychrobacter sp.]|nr:AMP-binding protein [Flavipsychrobacter sp.]